MKTAFALLVVAAGFATTGFAQEAEHRLGEHPAVLVKRAEATRTYDYQAQFYPHPAWLYLSSEAPHPMMDHPAVIVARRAREATQQNTTLAARAQSDASTR